jgi:protein TonB
MDFSKRQSDPRRHVVGLTVVILFHVAVVYALVTGLAKKVVEVIRAPIETKVIEEVRKPPPPPEIVVPPPPRLEAPPPPFIPPPEVQIAHRRRRSRPSPRDADPPPAPVAIVPCAARPGAGSAPRRRRRRPRRRPSRRVSLLELHHGDGRCRIPARSHRQGLDKGEALIQFTLTASGEIKDIKALRASHPIFARNSIASSASTSARGRAAT